MKYQVFKLSSLKFWNKLYIWIVADEKYGICMNGRCFTARGSKREAELYIAKVNDGRFFR